MSQALADALNHLALLVEASNKKATYFYDDITMKRWVLGPGGLAGNCEACDENEEAGWIEESDFFPAPGPDGYVDEPPLHPNCLCTVEYKDTRRRVYAD